MEHNILEPSNKANTKKAEKQHDYDIVDFYLQPELIKLITQQIAEQSKVNFAKVTEIKRAIKQHSFTIDPNIVSENIIKFETELFKSYKK